MEQVSAGSDYPPTSRITLTPAQLENILIDKMGWKPIDVAAVIKSAWEIGAARS